MTNDFKPDWDTVAAFNERISDLEEMNAQLREQNDNVGAACAELEAQNTALLEALKEIANAAELVETGRHSECSIDYEAWRIKANAAIAAVEALK